MKQRLDEEQREQWVRHDGGVGVIVHMPLTIRYPLAQLVQLVELFEQVTHEIWHLWHCKLAAE